MLAAILVSALSCNREEKLGVEEKWSSDPHVDSALAYNFAALQNVLGRLPFSYHGHELYGPIDFFASLTGIECSANLGTAGIDYSESDLERDYWKWWSWCRMNKDRLVWDSASSQVFFEADSTQQK